MRYSSFVSATLLCATLSFLPTQLALAETPTEFESKLAAISSPASAQKSAHDRLWHLFDTVWQYQMVEYPEWATSVGYPGQNGRWTDMSMSAIERRKHEVLAQMTALESIDRAALDKADQLNYDLFKYKLARSIEGQKFPDELLPINQLEGVQEAPANTIAQNPTKTIQDYEDIISRLRGVPKLIDQSIALMEAGTKAGITPPRVTLANVPQQIKDQIVEDPNESPLLAPFKKFPDTISPAEQQGLRETATAVYANEIAPAYRKLLAYFTEKYLPATRESLAFTALPNGKDWYAHNVRSSTTTQLTPAEIHQIGLNEVKRLRGEMNALMAEVKFQGTFPEFLQHMRTEPKFFFNSGDELLVGYRDIAKRIDPQLMTQFGKLPRLQYGIEAVPAYTEKSQPTAYYRSGSTESGRAGIFYANTYNIKTRPKWEMEALTLHEAVPGHHLQIALAQEMANVPEFRRHGHFTAYIEGWGLYAEGLGRDVGMYKEPYSRYGQLTYDMWRSIRLVLDTGIHSMGWTRQQAIDFFKENCSKSEHDIAVEVDRYIVWPGQALAYKVGQLTLKELRESAQASLGARFDVRKFHDKILSNGALPLDTLRSEVSQWIEQQKTVAATSGK